MTNESSKKKSETNAEIITRAYWPLTILVLMISFWTPMHNLADKLPNLIDRAESFSMAGIAIKISQNSQIKPNPEVEKIVSKLSPKGLKYLIQMQGQSITFSDAKSGAEVTEELRNLGILEQMTPSELVSAIQGNGSQGKYGIRITKVGQETQSFLLTFIQSLVSELNSPK